MPERLDRRRPHAQRVHPSHASGTLQEVQAARDGRVSVREPARTTRRAMGPRAQRNGLKPVFVGRRRPARLLRIAQLGSSAAITTQEVQNRVSKRRYGLTLSAAAAARFHRRVPGPAVIQPWEHAVRRRSRPTRIDPRRNPRVIDQRDGFVELTVQHQDASRDGRPRRVDIHRREFAEETLRTSGIR